MGTVALSAPKQNVVELPIGSVINLDGDDIGSGILQLLNEANPSVIDQTWNITSSPTGQIGPYATVRKLLVKANTGTVSYIVTAAPAELSTFKENLTVNGGGGGGGGGVTAVNATSPLVKTGTTTVALSLPAATTSAAGHMTAAHATALAVAAVAAPAPAAISASRNLAAADNGGTLYNTTGTAYTLTLPSGMPAGYGVAVAQLGAGAVTIAAGAGVTIANASSFTKTAGANTVITVLQTTANAYILAGQGAV